MESRFRPNGFFYLMGKIIAKKISVFVDGPRGSIFHPIFDPKFIISIWISLVPYLRVDCVVDRQGVIRGPTEREGIFVTGRGCSSALR